MDDPKQPQEPQKDTSANLDAGTTRFLGAIMLILGLACIGWMWYVHGTGASVADKIIYAGPLCLCLGLVTVAEPRLMMAVMGQSKEVGKPFQIAGYIVYALRVCTEIT